MESELRRVRESYSVLENARRQEEQRTTEKEKEVHIYVGCNIYQIADWTDL